MLARGSFTPPPARDETGQPANARVIAASSSSCRARAGGRGRITAMATAPGIPAAPVEASTSAGDVEADAPATVGAGSLDATKMHEYAEPSVAAGGAAATNAGAACTVKSIGSIGRGGTLELSPAAPAAKPRPGDRSRSGGAAEGLRRTRTDCVGPLSRASDTRRRRGRPGCRARCAP